MAFAQRIYPCHAFTSLGRSQPSMVSFFPTCGLRNGLESAGITTAMRCHHHHHSITISSVLSIQSRGAAAMLPLIGKLSPSRSCKTYLLPSVSTFLFLLLPLLTIIIHDERVLVIFFCAILRASLVHNTNESHAQMQIKYCIDSINA